MPTMLNDLCGTLKKGKTTTHFSVYDDTFCDFLEEDYGYCEDGLSFRRAKEIFSDLAKKGYEGEMIFQVGGSFQDAIKFVLEGGVSKMEQGSIAVSWKPDLTE